MKDNEEKKKMTIPGCWETIANALILVFLYIKHSRCLVLVINNMFLDSFASMYNLFKILHIFPCDPR